MRSFYWLHRRVACTLLMALLMMGLVPTSAVGREGELTIHVMNYSSQDAIILECDGHFAMVDSGEDNDYPDGSHALYPFRSGTIVGDGHEEEVIAYLRSLGATVESFDYYIGTHAHSDHIGSADEVIRAFCPSRVYVPLYSDEFIYDPSRLWDNQYVYDALKTASAEVGAVVITNLSEGAPLVPEVEGGAASPTFSLGSAIITVMNWDNHPLSAGAYQDANDYCWGVKVSFGGKSAFLAGDINNYGGDEDRLARQLGQVDVLKLGHHGFTGSNTRSYLQSLSPSVVIQTGSFSFLPKDVVNTLLDLRCHLYVCPEIAQQGRKATVVTISDGGVTVDALPDAESVQFRQDCGSYDVVAFRDSAPTSYQGEWVSPLGKIYQFNNSPFGTLIGTTTVDGGQWRHNSRGWWWRSPDGSNPQNEWKIIEGKTYFFDSSGYMQTGWRKIEGSWYYFDASGSLHLGWAKVGGKWYYLDPERHGVMVTGFFEVKGVKYYATSSGACPASSWVKDNGTWHLTSPSCAIRTGWAKVGGSWYLLDGKSGAMLTGWAKDAGSRYYLNKSGEMATGWLKLNGSWYHLSPSGAMDTGWKRVNGSWYLLNNKTGIMQTGWVESSGSRYYLNKSGVMAIGWLRIDGNWFYFNSSGAMQTGWVRSGSSWYWLDTKTGIMLTNGWTSDGLYVDGNGAWVKGKSK